MGGNMPIVVVSDPAGERSETRRLFSLNLNFPGERSGFHISATQGGARLADIVPVARSLCTAFVDATLRHLEERGARLLCHQGCCAACCRHLVSLSIPEAFRVAEEVTACPAEKRDEILQTHRRLAVWF